MKPIILIFKWLNTFEQTQPNKIDKYVELQDLDLENVLRLPKPELKIKETIKFNYAIVEPPAMNSFMYEYSKNWWKREHGHFNENLYKNFLKQRAPEIYY